MNFRPEVRPSVWEKLLRVLLFIGLVGTLATPALAVEVSGSASMYGYMRNDTVKHTQLAPALTMNVHDFGIKDLRLESSLRGYTDIRDGKSEDRRLRLWRGVLVWAPQESRWEVRLGQQWLTEGVGHGNIVGLWAKRRVGQRQLGDGLRRIAPAEFTQPAGSLRSRRLCARTEGPVARGTV